MQRLNSQRSASAKFINYTCNACNAEFGSSHAYNVHHIHPLSQGTRCSLDANKSEVTHTELAGSSNWIPAEAPRWDSWELQIGCALIQCVLTNNANNLQIIQIICK